MKGMETFLPVNEFDVIINSEDGERDTMHSGSFRNIICSAGKTYSIQWKLKGESKWHEIIERIPEKIKSINKQNFDLKDYDSFFIEQRSFIKDNIEV